MIQKRGTVVAERWLEKYLKEKGKTKKELAKTLWDDNLTAIAGVRSSLFYSFFKITDRCSQLCDDSFEGHVLPYPLKETGLHLHGLNRSTKEFITLPPATIDASASTWGFIQMP